ncbi:MAG: bifunctional demethylmenaquinone methyltransferase/2-methoxy-6-polyprenyl-1,4-benzoquinol methylase UbiE [Bdellovibrionota bacterium]
MSVKVEAKNVQSMFDQIAPKYDLTNSVLSMGIHHLWRRSLIKLVPSLEHGRVLDVCTGTGDLLPLLKQRFGSAIGLDFSFEMLEAGLNQRRDRLEKGLSPRIQGDALKLPFQSDYFDVITVSFGARNFENLTAGLMELYRVLKPGGSLLILEFGQPSNKLFASLYNWYSKNIMPLIGGLLTGNRTAYEYLPETAAVFPCRENFCELVNNCGFSATKYKSLSFGIAYAYHASKSSDLP